MRRVKERKKKKIEWNENEKRNSLIDSYRIRK